MNSTAHFHFVLLSFPTRPARPCLVNLILAFHKNPRYTAAFATTPHPLYSLLSFQFTLTFPSSLPLLLPILSSLLFAQLSFLPSFPFSFSVFLRNRRHRCRRRGCRRCRRCSTFLLSPVSSPIFLASYVRWFCFLVFGWFRVFVSLSSTPCDTGPIRFSTRRSPACLT